MIIVKINNNYYHLFPRQLSVEKSELEVSVANTNKALQRMSQNIVELNQKIRDSSAGYESFK